MSKWFSTKKSSCSRKKGDIFRISNKTEEIVKKLQVNLNFDTNEFEEEMDNIFFNIYEISQNDKNKIIKFTNNFYDDM